MDIHSFSRAYNPILLGALEENIINVEFADRQTWAACSLSLGSLSFSFRALFGIVLALETQDVPWPQEWLLTKSQDWQS